MNKKILAFAAAIVMAASAFTGCSSKPANNDTEVSMAVIQDGTEAPAPEESVDGTTVPGSAVAVDGEGNIVTDENGETVIVTSATFKDPAAEAGTSVSHDDEYYMSQTGEGTTVDEDKLAEMIEAGVTTTAAPKAPIMKEYNIDCTTRYGYNQLSSAEKELYKQMLDAVKSVKLRLEVDDSVTTEMWVKVYGCMYSQEPELFWIANKTEKGRFWYWEVEPEKIKSLQSEIDKKAGEVLALADGKSTYEKVKTFHDYIVLHDTFEMYDKSRISDTCFNFTVYGGLVGGRIQCEGYAKTMQYLCDLSGIESMVISGTNKDGDSHAWNVIKIDGKWYNVDATWDDPILSKTDPTNLRHRYFAVPDSWIHNKSHYNINMKVSGTKVKYFDPPACTAEDMNYFKQEGMLFSDMASAEKALKAQMKTAAANKTRVAEVRVSSKDVYDKMTSSANLKEYAQWIKGENSAVKSVSSNCDPETLVIELGLLYS
ncbi:MAG: hypothetical protein ILP19_01950 [Oscillospiraceae bacterium]|nr:hypothetical protein [Oscillospiraceae bacterium]